MLPERGYYVFVHPFQVVAGRVLVELQQLVRVLVQALRLNEKHNRVRDRRETPGRDVAVL
ncbi:hypothetical protein J7E24_08870 [Hymenobacter sp. ISL-91]|uniref:hypothetical protein n=1 Tax=Hymenobacter sp. ISL-91 TaxID=2819151 RepID=UPI001BE890DF|nr:hypothetical protein [Hymenobacter sp. ISL-91]MBT2557895.1 hypothetical protein [Hymenobacter sp. ISL-91]